MSTKRKKLYSKQDVTEAKVTDQKVKEYYSRRGDKRQTVQVRISKKWHSELKKLAREENLILSFLVDKLCEHFFKNCRDYKLQKSERKNSAETMRFNGSLLN